MVDDPIVNSGALVRPIARVKWNTLIAAGAGYMLDRMDVMLYAFALTTLKPVFGFDETVPDSASPGTSRSASLREKGAQCDSSG